MHIPEATLTDSRGSQSVRLPGLGAAWFMLLCSKERKMKAGQGRGRRRSQQTPEVRKAAAPHSPLPFLSWSVPPFPCLHSFSSLPPTPPLPLFFKKNSAPGVPSLEGFGLLWCILLDSPPNLWAVSCTRAWLCVRLWAVQDTVRLRAKRGCLPRELMACIWACDKGSPEARTAWNWTRLGVQNG